MSPKNIIKMLALLICIFMTAAIPLQGTAAENDDILFWEVTEDAEDTGYVKEGYGVIYLHAIVEEDMKFPIYVRIFGSRDGYGEFDVFLTPDRDYSLAYPVPEGSYLVFQRVDMNSSRYIAVSDVTEPLLVEENGNAHANIIAGSPEFVDKYKAVLYETDVHGKVESGNYSHDEMDTKLAGASQESLDRYEKEKEESFITEFEPDNGKPLELVPAEIDEQKSESMRHKARTKYLMTGVVIAALALLYVFIKKILIKLGN